MKRKALLVIAACMSLSLVQAENAEPTMQEFYAGSEINIKEDKPLQQTLVPYHVYEVVKSPSLNDIRVFNSSAGLVPHRISEQKKDSQTSTKILSFAKLTSNADGLENLIEKYKSSGVDISLNLRALDANASNSQLDVYIGEIVEFEGKGTRLKLDWELNQEVSTFFLADVDITDDFKHWENIAEGVNLAQLKTNEAIVKHNQIKLNRFGKKFYRISIHGERRPDIKKIELIVSQQQDRPYSITEEIMGKHDESDNQIVYYTQPAKIIKKRLNILIPENNVMADCRVYSRDNDDQNWTLRGSGTVYRITNNDEALMNQMIDLRASSDREWKLEVLNSGSGFEQQPPAISFLWQPHTLTFVARGGSPFILAYGSAAYAVKSTSQNSFFNTKNNEEDQLIAFSSTSDKIDVLGGENVLKEDLIKVTPKTMVLWGILIAGSLLLLFMALSMLKSTSKNGNES